ncbi:MAG: hypothetical protein HOW73_41350 [Polyangiaceae bacterium]|nr:hypothetical protein [Polyangiaceae bacterium]
MTAPLLLPIRGANDVLVARAVIRGVGRDAGLAPREVQSLEIVASELAWNILQHAKNGSLEVSTLPDGSGIAIAATDSGPWFHDLAVALRDGCDDRGPIDPQSIRRRRGIGGGLGAVVRLTHSFEVKNLPQGKRIEVVRRGTNGPTTTGKGRRQ